MREQRGGGGGVELITLLSRQENNYSQIKYNCRVYLHSMGATALLINRASGKGLIVDSTSANGPLLGNPFLTSTGWCKKYFFYVFFNFTVTHHSISQLTQKYKKHN